MNKRILAVFAHPDDEAFGPGGTLAYYAEKEVSIHLLCATRGEAGQWNKKKFNKNRETKIHHIREKELIESAKILGVEEVEFLDYVDGKLCNAIYHEFAEKIIRKINSFKPQVILTLDRLGVSGHLDHIAVSMITTYAFRKTLVPSKLYYHCLPKERYDKRMKDYFIYFPEGYDMKDITTHIDFSSCWEKKAKAMRAHKSQAKDAEQILKAWKTWKKIDYFILQYHRGIKTQFPEHDLFSGFPL